MLIFRSIRLRLTLWYVLLLAVVLAVFCAGIYFALRQSLSRNLNEAVENRVEVLLGLIEYDSGRPTLAGVELPGDKDTGETFARVFDGSGGVTFDDSTAFGGVPVDDSAVEQALRDSPATRSVKGDERTLRVRIVPIQGDPAVVGALEVGLNEDDVADTLGILLLIMTIAYPVTLAVASFGGVFLAGRALSPIDRLTGLAQRISAADLSQRLDLDLPNDELGRLARTFDEMISRLDGAFQRQRQFTADASHELRTPLTAIKGQAEVALQRDRNPEAYRQSLAAIDNEADRMIRLTASLLNLARADSGQIPITFESLDVAEVIGAAAEQARPAAEQRRVRLVLNPSPHVHLAGDKVLLIQLTLNLLDNAVKYSPPGGEVTVGCENNDSEVVLRVRDTGIGIEPDAITHIFDRFYRVDRARSRTEGGAGLGLSISRWIAEAHGGSISVQSEPGKGSTFSVRLPLRR